MDSLECQLSRSTHRVSTRQKLSTWPDLLRPFAIYEQDEVDGLKLASVKLTQGSRNALHLQHHSDLLKDE